MIVELKQWERADPTEMDGIVRTVIGGAPRDTPHPSYQAWAYAELLRDFERTTLLTLIMLSTVVWVIVAGIGADNGDKHELAPDLLARNTLVVDSLEQCAAIGDLHHALAAGAMELGAVHAELGDVVAGARRGRTAPDEITVFDSTGIAIQDVAAAAGRARSPVPLRMPPTLGGSGSQGCLLLASGAVRGDDRVSRSAGRGEQLRGDLAGSLVHRFEFSLLSGDAERRAAEQRCGDDHDGELEHERARDARQPDLTAQQPRQFPADRET